MVRSLKDLAVVGITFTVAAGLFDLVQLIIECVQGVNMANHNFGEKKTENIKGVDCPVWQTPKYAQAKAKAIEMIE